MPTVTLAVLARNEEASIGAAIASAARWVDEVVVRDTGSRDGTVEAARQAGATVVRGSWHDDFAEARNLLLDAANTDWVLFLDADERLEAGGESLRALLSLEGTASWSASIRSEVGFGRSETSEAPRLVRRAGRPRFRHRVHERLEAPAPPRPSPLRIRHDGFLPSRRHAKCRRNLGLLELEMRERPDDPWLVWRRARELEILDRRDEAEQGYAAAGSLLARLDVLALAALDWAPEAVADWTELAADRGQARGVLGLATRTALAHPQRPLARFLHARVLAAAGREADAERAAAALVVPGAWECRAAGEAEILARQAPGLLQALRRLAPAR